MVLIGLSPNDRMADVEQEAEKHGEMSKEVDRARQDVTEWDDGRAERISLSRR